MMTAPETRPSLLLRMKNPHDQQAWTDFYEIYHPLIIRLALLRGLQKDDAEEVAQEVLVAVSKSIERWEVNPERGSFRNWLSKITRNLVINFLIRQSRHPQGTGGSAVAELLHEVPAVDGPESQLFDLEQRRQLFLWAASQIEAEFRADLWQVFWQTSVAGREIAEVAREFRMSTGTVYVARSRIMKRLREKVEAAEGLDSESKSDSRD